MKFILCIQRKDEVKVLGMNNVMDGLIMVTATCDAVAEKIQKEKKIGKSAAMKLVTDSILQSYCKLRRE